MAEEYRVILSADALADLEGIARYIRDRSPQNAPVVAEKILDAIDSLAVMPRRFKQVGGSRKRGSAIHAMVVRPFIVYYRAEDQPAAVHVLHVRHGHRRQPRQFD